VLPGREAAPVSLLDVAPTLLEAVGLALPAGLEGVSLWPNLTSGAALPARALGFENALYREGLRGALRWPWKVVLSGDGTARHWNLERDPAERAPGDGPLPAPAQALIAELRAVQPAGLPEPAALDAATREGLRALGYLE
jgi:arylsulfatase A-like enzyme